jgi:hypothetical protein
LPATIHRFKLPAARWKTPEGASSVGGAIHHCILGIASRRYMREAHDNHRLDQVDPDDSQLSV